MPETREIKGLLELDEQEQKLVSGGGCGGCGAELFTNEEIDDELLEYLV